MPGAPTILTFVSHACVVVRHEDCWVLTDPWFVSPAFSSWSPTPPPFVNAAVWPTLARSGRLALLLSHCHADHVDEAFLRTLPPATPCFVPEYGDAHFTGFLAGLGLSAVREIATGAPERFGHFTFHRFPHHDSRTDSVLALETPDAFLLHANDSFRLSEEARRLLAATKPAGKADLFLGQGGSASGYPLTYDSIPEPERPALLRAKNEAMLRELAATARECGFRRALAYACFASVHVEGRRYETPLAHGRYANEVTDGELFLDLSPGDLYVPAEDRVLSPFGSLHWDWSEAPPVAGLPARFPDVAWTEALAAGARALVAGLEEFLGEGSDVRFSWEIVGPAGEPVDEIVTRPARATRRKRCRVTTGVAAAVVEGKIPFEDLYTGYLGTWSREPDEYNRGFLQALMEYGYRYRERTRFGRR